MAKDWENIKDRFEVVDVRKLTGNFLIIPFFGEDCDTLPKKPK
jgi:hypothetical protein